ncbi:MAG: ABC transporter substrate binding protein [Candidatus Auribacterota bacterium]|nr:ABC transporter substrate binding protein [Candidatus Auribacterota bacterium]
MTRFGSCLCLIFFLTISFTSIAFTSPREVRIALVSDGPYYYGEEMWGQFKIEMEAFAGDEFRFVYPSNYQIIGNWNPETIRSNCREVLDAPEIDVVVGEGLITASFFAAQTDLPKPVLLFGDADLELAGLETEEGHSRVKNLTFQVDRGKILKDVKRMKELSRSREVIILIDPEVVKSIPGVEDMGRAIAAAAGLSISYAYYGSTVDETMAGLPDDTGFIYITPSLLFNTRKEIRSLLEEINRKKIHTFAMEGRPIVELGALAGLYSGSIEKIARNNALKLYEILKGKAPEKQNVNFRDKEQFTINMDTARKVDYYPTYDLLLEAELINEEREEGPLITLREAVRIALKNNLSYQMARRTREEEEHSYRQTLGNLLPQMEATADYQRIDSDRAKSSLGMLPRWQTQGGLTLDQLIFDYPVWKSVSLARMSVELAEHDQEIVGLDTAQNAIKAYFNVLQARELLHIGKENLDSTRNHLNIARVRRQEEVGSREDVLRLESEYKSALTAIIEASFKLKNASLQFNEILNRPQEATFRLEQIGPEEETSVSVFSSPRIDSLLTNQKEAELLRNFLVEAGDLYSPEIKLARLNVRIAEEDLSRARAEIWSPTIGARAEYNRVLGEEVWNPDPAGDGAWGGSGAYPDDDEWTLAGYVSIPIWQGGRNWAGAGKKKVTLRKARQALDLQKQGTALAIRSAFFDLAAASTRYELEQDREQLARESQELVEDKYRQGALPLINLLDAQSQYVNSRAETVTAFYTSILDLVEVERRTGFLEYLRSPEELKDFIEEMEEYLQEDD